MKAYALVGDKGIDKYYFILPRLSRRKVLENKHPEEQVVTVDLQILPDMRRKGNRKGAKKRGGGKGGNC